MYRRCVQRRGRFAVRRVSLVPQADRIKENFLSATRTRPSSVRGEIALHCYRFYWQFQKCFRIVEYQGLLPFEESDLLPDHKHARTRKEVLNLPLGCEVNFDEKVLKVFADQSLDPRYATRHNIGRILLYEYEKLERHLGRSRPDVTLTAFQF